jgi:hypothetical protein
VSILELADAELCLETADKEQSFRGRIRSETIKLTVPVHLRAARTDQHRRAQNGVFFSDLRTSDTGFPWHDNREPLTYLITDAPGRPPSTYLGRYNICNMYIRTVENQYDEEMLILCICVTACP